MSTPILATKLYIPAPPPTIVARPRLVERLNAGLHRKLTLISAPAGFGKTTLVSAWAASCGRQVAWLSLDEADNDLTRFLTYLVAAVQSIAANAGEDMLRRLQSPSPPQVRVVITTREDPQLPLARLRGSGQLSELRVSALRFSASEAAAFLNQ